MLWLFVAVVLCGWSGVGKTLNFFFQMKSSNENKKVSWKCLKMGCRKLTYRTEKTLHVVKSECSREQKVEWMWLSVDPLAEEREWLSPYNFVQNNPINRIDPDGALDESAQGPLTDIWKLFKNEDGTYNAEKQHINDGKNDQIYLVMGDDGVATSMYQGVEAEANMSKDGISISERDNGTTTMSAIKDATVDFWTSDEYRTRNARETMVNYVTSVIPAEGLLFGMLGKATKGGKLVDDAVVQAKKWLGKGYKPITNKAGDHIFMSKDKLRKIRFDIKNSQGDAPHIHLETFRNGKWRDAVKGSHRIYPKK